MLLFQGKFESADKRFDFSETPAGFPLDNDTSILGSFDAANKSLNEDEDNKEPFWFEWTLGSLVLIKMAANKTTPKNPENIRNNSLFFRRLDGTRLLGPSGRGL